MATNDRLKSLRERIAQSQKKYQDDISSGRIAPQTSTQASSDRLASLRSKIEESQSRNTDSFTPEYIQGLMDSANVYHNNLSNRLNTYTKYNKQDYDKAIGYLLDNKISGKESIQQRENINLLKAMGVLSNDEARAMTQTSKDLFNMNNNLNKQAQYVNSFGDDGSFFKASSKTDSDREVRQRKYNDNKDRILAIDRELAQLEKASGYHNFASGGFNGLAGNSKQQDQIYKLRNEKHTLEQYNNMYERSENKSWDDYFDLRNREDFEEVSSKRNLGNSAKDYSQETRDKLDQRNWYSDSFSGKTYTLGGEEVNEENIRKWQGEVSQPDKLGVFLGASASQRKEAAIGEDQIGGTLSETINEGVNSYWDKLTDDEVKTYYYLYNTEGQQKAYDYLDSMAVNLGRRHQEDVQADMASASGFKKILYNAMSVPANVYGGLIAGVDNIVQKIRGQEQNPYSVWQSAQNFASDIRAQTSQDIEQLTGGASFMGISLSDVYQTVMSAADSWAGGRLFLGGLSAGMGSWGYGTAMGMGAMSSNMKEMFEAGESTENIFAYGVLTGIMEEFWEQASIENILKMKDPTNAKTFAMNLLKSFSSEAQEEFCTDLADDIIQTIYMGDGSEIMQSFYKYKDMGMSDAEAQTKVFMERFGSALKSGFLGGLSGALSGGFQSTMGLINNNNIAYNKAVDLLDPRNRTETHNTLMNLAQEVANKTDNKSLSKQVQKTNDSVKKMDNSKRNYNQAVKQTAKLNTMMDTLRTEQNRADIRKALAETTDIKDRKTKLGRWLSEMGVAESEMTRAVNAASNIIEDQRKGKYASADDINELADIEGSREVLAQLMAQDSNISKRNAQDFYGRKGIILDENGNPTEESLEEYQGREADQYLAERGLIGKDETHKDFESKVAAYDTEYSLKTAEDGISSVDGNEINLQDAKLVTRDGNLALSIGDNTYSVDSVTYGKDSDAQIIETLNSLKMDSVNAETIWRGYDESMDAKIYAQAVREAFTYGKYGMQYDLSKNSFVDKLPENIRKTAYEAGRQYTKYSTDQAAKLYDTAGKGKTRKGKLTVEGNIKWDTKTELGQRKSASFRTVALLTKALNLNVHVFESYEEDGKRYAVVNGQKTDAAPNGAYVTGKGEIWIDINAGNNFESTMLYTMSHEVTHFMAEYAKREYQQLVDYLVKEYGEKGESVEDLVAKQIAKSDYALDFEAALEEFVADSMQSMLASEEVVYKLAKMKQSNEGLFNKLKNAFLKLFQKIKALYKGIDPDTYEGKFVQSLGDRLEALQDLFVNGVVQASENYKYLGDGLDVTADNTVVLSQRQYRETGRNELQQYMYKQYGKADGDQLIEQIDKIYNLINQMKADNPDLEIFSRWAETEIELDENGNPVATTSIKNNDYKLNQDFSRVCKKRRQLDMVLNLLAEDPRFRANYLKEEDFVKINRAIKSHGFEIACDLCFVDTKRYRQAEWADSFAGTWNDILRSLVGDKVELTPFNFATDKVDLSDPGVTINTDGKIDYHKWSKGKQRGKVSFKASEFLAEKSKLGNAQTRKMAQLMINHPELRHTFRAADIIASRGFDTIQSINKELRGILDGWGGNSVPKPASLDASYDNSILNISGYNSKNAFAMGGMRMNSFSDFMAHMFFDYCQALADATAKGLPAQAYTKELAFARFYGKMGIKGNMSGIPAVRANALELSGIKKTEAAKNKALEQRIAGLDVSRLEEYLGKTIDKISEAELMNNLDKCDYLWAKESIDMKKAILLQTGILYDMKADGKNVFSESQIDRIYQTIMEKGAQAGYDLAESINPNAVDADYAENIGTIVVGVSEAHIRKLLRDPTIRMVIPYHASGISHIVAASLKIAAYVDNTWHQSTGVYPKGAKKRANLGSAGFKTSDFLKNWKDVLTEAGEEVKDATVTLQDFSFYDYFGELDGKGTANKYLEWCKNGVWSEEHQAYGFYTKNKHIPFVTVEQLEKKLRRSENGYLISPKFEMFSNEENYYKVLEDFDCYNTLTEEHAPQTAVDFKRGLPTDWMDVLLTEAKAEQQTQEDYRKALDKPIRGANKSLKEEIMEILGDRYNLDNTGENVGFNRDEYEAYRKAMKEQPVVNLDGSQYQVKQSARENSDKSVNYITDNSGRQFVDLSKKYPGISTDELLQKELNSGGIRILRISGAWASAFIGKDGNEGVKHYETKEPSFPTSYEPGPVYIYQNKGDVVFKGKTSADLVKSGYAPGYSADNGGKILFRANLDEIRVMDEDFINSLSAEEKATGDYKVGRRAIKLSNIQPLKTPYALHMRGQSVITYTNKEVTSERYTNGIEQVTKFSVRGNEPNQVQESQKLIAVHNLTEDNLLKLLKLGGIPSPSIAILKSHMEHFSFGDISLFFDKDSIDPGINPKNKVYDRDAETPGFPEVKEFIPYEKIMGYISPLIDSFKEMTGQDFTNEYLIESLILNKAGSTSKGLYNNAGVRGLFLSENVPGFKEKYLKELNDLNSGTRSGYYLGGEIVREYTSKISFDEFEKWLKSKLGEPLSPEKYIRQGTKERTKNRAGRYASSLDFYKSQEWLPYSLDSAVEAMGNEYSYIDRMEEGAAKEYKKKTSRLYSVDEIREKSNRITGRADYRNGSADYFEAKPGRGMGFGEIKGVVLPYDTADVIKDTFIEMGIPVVEYAEDYDDEIENYMDRVEAFQVVANLTKWSQRDISNRELLANALKSTTTTKYQRDILKDYEKRMFEMGLYTDAVKDIAASLAKERSPKKKAKNIELINTLKNQLSRYEEKIAKIDSQLLKLERMKPIRELLDHEKQQLSKQYTERGRAALTEYKRKAEERLAEVVAKNRESRHNAVVKRQHTELKNDIQNKLNKLSQYLNRGNSKLNVKQELKTPTAQALALFQSMFSTQENTLATLQSIDLAKYPAESKKLLRLQELYSLINLTEDKAEREKLVAEKRSLTSELREIIDTEQANRNKSTLHEGLDALATVYEGLKNSDKGYIRQAYDENIADSIRAMTQNNKNVLIKDMSVEQLANLKKIVTMITHTVTRANKFFAQEKYAGVESAANTAISELEANPRKNTSHRQWDAYWWNNLKPVYAFKRMGSKVFQDLFSGIRNGEDQWARDITQFKDFYVATANTYKYNTWDMDKTFEFKDAIDNNKTFKLSLQQMMSIYALSKREQSRKHLVQGGFVYDPNATVKDGKKKKLVNDFADYKLSYETINEIVRKLTPEQKKFVDITQGYLSTVVADKGNEVSMDMLGVKLFNEGIYFPINSAEIYNANVKNENAGADIKIKSYGFTKDTIQNANNPLVLSNYGDVWSKHVNEMAMYHSFTRAIDDFNKVYDYKTFTEDGKPNTSVSASIDASQGTAARNYINQMLKDINGGARMDSREGAVNAMMSRFKMTAVAMNLQVVIQQPSAIGRSFSVINPKYFLPGDIKMGKYSDSAAEMMKYAPVAVIKDMGYFDTDMGMSSQDYIQDIDPENKLQAFFKDSDYRSKTLDKISGWLPGKADEVTWVTMWKATKRWVADTTKLKVNSEEFLQECGKRFTDMIVKTQVYDSVLSRSANMRSKSGLMKMITAFMAEPTTTANMVEDALRNLKSNPKGAAKILGSVLASILINSALKAVTSGARDDDEDETYGEKYTEAFVGGVLDGLNPATYLPYIKDVWSIITGYDVERSDMSLVTEIVKRTQYFTQAFRSTGDDRDERIQKASIELAVSIANLFGIPAKNMYKDVKAVGNVIGLIGTENKTQIGRAIKSAITDYFSFLGAKEDSKSTQLYEAITSGNKEWHDRLAKSYKDDKTYGTALVKGLRENDERIRKAAQYRYDGDVKSYMALAKEIIGEGNFTQDEVVSAINYWYNKLNTEDSSTGTSQQHKKLVSTEDWINAFAMDDLSTADAVKQSFVETVISNGYNETEAEKKFNSALKTDTRDAYEGGSLDRDKAAVILRDYLGMDDNTIDSTIKSWDFYVENGYGIDEIDDALSSGSITRAEAINKLIQAKGLTEDEAESKVAYWEFKNMNPGTKITEDNYKKYVNTFAGTGVSADVFEQYVVATTGMSADVDKNGKSINGTKKKKIMVEIDKLPITNAQKDLFYYMNNWAKGTINEAPWH